MLIAAVVPMLFAGCVTTDDQQTSDDLRLRTLYPRRYIDSLDPWERRHAESEIGGEDPFEKKR